VYRITVRTARSCDGRTAKSSMRTVTLSWLSVKSSITSPRATSTISIVCAVASVT
jgi:hypothetical protein